MDEELKSLIKVCVSATISVSYCYFIPPRIKPGLLRLLFIFPVCVLLCVLPLLFSSKQFIFITSFFLTSIGNVKLILLAFDQGPLYPLPSNLTQFVCFTCFPIQPRKSSKTYQDLHKWIFAIKVVIIGVMLYVYNPSYILHPILILFLRPLYDYLLLEVPLSLLRMLLTTILGCDLEPHFDQPYLATSLQEFWGRRWNLMVSSTLRSGVYIPVRRVCEPLMSSYRAKMTGFLATFIVSGVAHELLFFCMNHETPSWEATLFFLLNGVCMVVEMAVKRRKWQVNPVISWMLTMGFLSVTSYLLLFR